MTRNTRFWIILLALILLLGCANGRGVERLESRVSRLVEQAAKSENAEKKSFAKLESLGYEAVPYLVGHLGDVRPLVTREISINNSSADSFEGVRYYRPATVHDALAAILNQITGQNFVFVYNGATPKDRRENIRKWVDWCRSTYPDQAEACDEKK